MCDYTWRFPEMRAREVSVVICAYTEERWEQTCAAVDSVRSQSLTSLEIILVVDYNDALYQRATVAMPDVIVVENRERRGLSGARNTGAARAQGEIIAFIDDDATAHEDWLKFLADVYENSAVVGSGGLTMPRWLTTRPSWMPEEFYWVIGCNYAGLPPSGATVRNLLGANMSFRREAFELVKSGFTAGIGRTATGRPFGCEETEFCIRLGRALPGSLLVMDHRAVIWHNVPKSRCTVSYFLSRCYAEGLSKARIIPSVGGSGGLATEYAYATRKLPLAVARGVGDVLRGDPAGLGRATAIIAGLAMTATGYANGKLGWPSRTPTV
jgi:glycosyltransferase involved in cell wall biosynthesis